MKIARVRDKKIGTTYAIISRNENKLISKSEIQEQTGIPLPQSVKEFMFNGWLEEVKHYDNELKYELKLEDVDLLTPLPNPSKIICMIMRRMLA